MMTALRTLFAAAFALASPLQAQTLDDIVTLEVLPGWSTSSGAQMAGLRITLADGWKTYWRAPGDAGIPPQFSFEGSDNVGDVRVQWPTPQVFHQGGMRSIGYDRQVILPIEIERETSGDMTFAGTLAIGVCEDICVPVHLDFAASLPEGGSRDPLIVASLVDRPLRADEAGVQSASCAIRPVAHGLEVTATLTLPPVGAAETVVIEASDAQVWVSEPTVSRTGATLTATSIMAHVTGGTFAIDRSDMRFTVLADGTAVDIRGCTAG